MREVPQEAAPGGDGIDFARRYQCHGNYIKNDHFEVMTKRS